MTITYPHFTKSAARTWVNALIYVLSGRRRLVLEGRYKRGHYRNWSGDRRHRSGLAQPTTEAEVAQLIRGARSIRVVGSGHSFNDGLSTDDVTLSLDKMSGVLSVDPGRKRATVLAGTRLRDLNPALADYGLALRSLASHDAQSVAGILSSDVHGTGRQPAHLSDQVVSLRLIDGNGTAHRLEPTDDLFRAAVGGVGSVGVITEVTVQCVPAFRLEVKTEVRTRSWAEENLDRLMAEHEHVSFYAYPFTDLVHVHTWTGTDAERSPMAARREAMHEAKAAISAATIGDAMAHTGLLPRAATFGVSAQKATSLVLDSYEAFSRSQYHLHQELEAAVPRHRVWTDLDETLAIYEDLYRQQRLPFLLVEVRFSPAGHGCTLLGAGAERDSAWLCWCCNQSGAVGRYFDAVEQWARSNDARPHLGKWAERLDATDLARLHGERYDRFQQVRAVADPEGKFTNAFTERVLGPVRVADGSVRRP